MMFAGPTYVRPRTATFSLPWFLHPSLADPGAHELDKAVILPPPNSIYRVMGINRTFHWIISAPRLEGRYLPDVLRYAQFAHWPLSPAVGVLVSGSTPPAPPDSIPHKLSAIPKPHPGKVSITALWYPHISVPFRPSFAIRLEKNRPSLHGEKKQTPSG
jgi:hypothetical protein